MAKSKPRTLIQPETEGQRLFCLVEGTEVELADKIACASALIGHWRRGRRTPSEKQRHRLELLFGIPRRAWDIGPGLPVPERKQPTKEATEDTEPASVSRAKDLDTLAITNMQIDEILDALDNENITDTAQARLRDTLSKSLALRTRLERDRELLEDRIVREHPSWLKLKKDILSALREYPEATKAVIRAIGGKNDFTA